MVVKGAKLSSTWHMIKPNLDSIVWNFNKQPKKFINGDHFNHEIHDWRMSTCLAIMDVFVPKSRSLRQVNIKYGGALNRNEGKLERGSDGCADLWACFVEEERSASLSSSFTLLLIPIRSFSLFLWFFITLLLIPIHSFSLFLWFFTHSPFPFSTDQLRGFVSLFSLLWKIGLEFCSNKYSNHHGHNPSH